MIESRNVSQGSIRRRLGQLVAALVCGLLAAPGAWSRETLQEVLKRRGLSQQDVLAAAKTYVPTGKRDEFLAFSSGGQSGMVIVYGIPSMRILKYIAVFNPEPWQGYGFEEESKAVLDQGRIDGRDITWGDTHHPALSETAGKDDRLQPRSHQQADAQLGQATLDRGRCRHHHHTGSKSAEADHRRPLTAWFSCARF